MGKKSDRREQRIAAAKAREAALHEGDADAGLSHFQRVIKALTMCAPIALVLRHEDGLNHCIEASVCAAAALGRRQITARVVQCVVVAAHRRMQGLVLPVGITPRQMYDRINWGDVPVLPYETWKAQHANSVPDEKWNTHAVVEAVLGDERAIIDLTLGQLREAPMPEAKTIPWQIVLSGEGWPQFESSDWSITYGDTLHSQEIADEVEAVIRGWKNPAFVADLHDAMTLALQCGLNETRFRAELKRQHPEDFEVAMSRIVTLGGLSTA